ncbi:hypothetical protein DF107_35330 [Burkholderia stagnalis]|uniref:Uncharacterized protein n=2 Tax=Burkholderia stagnalis TaxID=1503054 RepID=A0A119RYA5_9BURK|nr:hypothetical protein [Burkholderia stagnalis]AOK53294.1 hypothetical protein WT74_11695 [Burkholderia stagnalis]KAB0634050.1 hypothetical protein F7R25_28025 [Burkholderia stagnalis]KVD91168.1 hypothetical protein WS63_12000 [Burkholderia stagnalis]KVL96769.1 hypothetical protein WT02_15245 [Burkholderia stagnalis]KVM00002.1 hypothetical protein WT03_03945 [Burkholderia stagnalis]
MGLIFYQKGKIMRLRIDVQGVSRMRAGLAGALLVHALAGYAATASQPLILDTQRGIQDGKGGLLLQTAPLSREPIVAPATMRTPVEQTPNSSVPVFVAPYIQVPTWPAPPAGQPRPLLQPRQP